MNSSLNNSSNSGQSKRPDLKVVIPNSRSSLVSYLLINVFEERLYKKSVLLVDKSVVLETIFFHFHFSLKTQDPMMSMVQTAIQ